MPLIVEPNLDDPDGFYADLVALHADLDQVASERVNARLILILANHIGDRSILASALSAAGRQGDG